MKRNLLLRIKQNKEQAAGQAPAAILVGASAVDNLHTDEIDISLYLKRCIEASVFILGNGCGKANAGRYEQLPAPEILCGTTHAQRDCQGNGRMSTAAAACAILHLYDDGDCDAQETVAAFAELFPAGLTADRNTNKCQGRFGAVRKVIDAERLDDPPLECTSGRDDAGHKTS